MLYIVSLGGSLIAPDKVDHPFVMRFAEIIAKEAKQGGQFFIVTGGGAAARRNIAELKQSRQSSAEDLDWAGIQATKDNAKILVSALGELARPEIISDPSRKQDDLASINVASGWKPGHSTDLVAVKLAETYGSHTVINLSNIDYVFDKDPKVFPDAKKFEKMTWPQFRSLFGDRWSPGANVPFDPVGAALAEKNNTKVIIMNGLDLKNFQNFLSAKNFKGTVIN